MSVERQAIGAVQRLPDIPAGPYPFVPRLPVPASTSVAGLDAAVEAVRARSTAWLTTTADERVRLLDAASRATLAVADRWIDLVRSS